MPIHVGDVVEGGPARQPSIATNRRGVVVGNQTRMGRVAASLPKLDEHGDEMLDDTASGVWDDEDDVVQGIVLLRKGEQSLPALADVAGQDRRAQRQPGRTAAGRQDRHVLRPHRT